MSLSASITISGNSVPKYLSIADVQGRILDVITVDQNQKVILDRKDFVRGMFYVSLLNEKHELIDRRKLVVQ